jgi:hypothetical protein
MASKLTATQSEAIGHDSFPLIAKIKANDNKIIAWLLF